MGVGWVPNSSGPGGACDLHPVPVGVCLAVAGGWGLTDPLPRPSSALTSQRLFRTLCGHLALSPTWFPQKRVWVGGTLGQPVWDTGTEQMAAAQQGHGEVYSGKQRAKGQPSARCLPPIPTPLHPTPPPAGVLSAASGRSWEINSVFPPLVSGVFWGGHTWLWVLPYSILSDLLGPMDPLWY